MASPSHVAHPLPEIGDWVLAWIGSEPAVGRLVAEDRMLTAAGTELAVRREELQRAEEVPLREAADYTEALHPRDRLGRWARKMGVRHVIAVDGTAGSGKTTIAREVARQVDGKYVDAGAILGVGALISLRGGDPVAAIDELELREEDRLWLDGENVTWSLDTPEVKAEARRLAADERVMAAVRDRVAQAADEEGVTVVDGRDSGVVLGAETRAYVDAAIGVRAARVESMDKDEAATMLRARDARDDARLGRAFAESQVRIDSHEYGTEEAAKEIVRQAERNVGMVQVPSAEEIAAGFASVTSRDHPDGWEVEVDKLDGTPETRLVIDGRIVRGFTEYDEDHVTEIGGFRRTFSLDDGKLVVEHDALSVEYAEQGARVSSDFFAQMIEKYREWGVSEVRTSATSVGKYAWARAGFEAASLGSEDPEEARRLEMGRTRESWERAAREAVERGFARQEEADALIAALDGGIGSMAELAGWGREDGSRWSLSEDDPDFFQYRRSREMWLGKWVLLRGDPWRAALRLTQREVQEAARGEERLDIVMAWEARRRADPLAHEMGDGFYDDDDELWAALDGALLGEARRTYIEALHPRNRLGRWRDKGVSLTSTALAVEDLADEDFLPWDRFDEGLAADLKLEDYHASWAQDIERGDEIFWKLGLETNRAPEDSMWPPRDVAEIAETMQEAFQQYPMLGEMEGVPLHGVVFTSGHGELAEYMHDMMPSSAGAGIAATKDWDFQMLVLNDRYPPLVPVSENMLVLGDGGVTEATGSSFRGLIWHEMGHALAHASGWDETRRNRAGREELHIELFDHYGFTFDELSSLSMYAASSPIEALAELTAMYHVMPEKLPPPMRIKASMMFGDFAAGLRRYDVEKLERDGEEDDE